MFIVLTVPGADTCTVEVKDKAINRVLNNVQKTKKRTTAGSAQASTFAALFRQAPEFKANRSESQDSSPRLTEEEKTRAQNIVTPNRHGVLGQKLKTKPQYSKAHWNSAEAKKKADERRAKAEKLATPDTEGYRTSAELNKKFKTPDCLTRSSNGVYVTCSLCPNSSFVNCSARIKGHLNGGHKRKAAKVCYVHNQH